MIALLHRAALTGGRRYLNPDQIAADLGALVPFGLDFLTHGDALGADAFADDAARALGLRVEPVAADETRDGPWPGAGNRRNVRMLDTWHPEATLAYPDPRSSGTWHCVAESLRRNIATIVLLPPGARPDDVRGFIDDRLRSYLTGGELFRLGCWSRGRRVSPYLAGHLPHPAEALSMALLEVLPEVV